ncbi:aspartyl protease family protein At5g10770-like [Euphorbia lathyris]|uniref:aspartyl protease family protein At5g10770-like n=1 Tax=Euphorbia lathyris TaxID=212925 RepID=UPI0033143B0C
MASFIFNSCFIYLCIVFSLLRCEGVHAFEGRKIAENNEHLLQLQLNDLLPSHACKLSTTVGENATSMKVVHKHGPCSQLSENVAAPNLLETLIQDQARVDSINSKILWSSDQSDVRETDATKLPATSGVSLGTGNYVVTVGFGTPMKKLPLIFDTGSDLTWTRCTSRDQFNPIRSKSYFNVSCSSRLCSSVTTATGNSPKCTSSTCVYGIEYGDGSYSIGFLAKEKLSLGSVDTFENFYFGCGQDNDGLFGDAAGLIGLGRAKLSIVSQTETKYKKLFSYCIPSSSSTGFLNFGASISKTAKFTPLSTKSSASSFYDLDLIGITVGGKTLSIPPSVFSTAGTIIDSGTVITRLPPSAYSALRSTFRAAMSRYPLTKALSILDTCYDFSKFKTINVPKILLSFNGGTKLAVDVQGVFISNGVQQVCLAFAGNNDGREKGIIGNTQQKNYEVIYDVGRGKVGFAPGAC